MFSNNDGGFFMPSNVNNGFGGQGTGDAYQMHKGQGQQEGGQRRKNRVFAPVTMKMIQEASPRPDDVCEIEGEAINDIIIVGTVIAKQEEPMRTLFEINDNTGVFKVIFYQKGENEVPMALKNFNYDNLGYVKVYGTIRVFKEEKAIVGTHIKRVDKFDEVTNHFLQVFVAHCIRKKGVLSNRDLGPQQQQQVQGRSSATMQQAAQMGGDAKQTILSVMKELTKNNNRFIHQNDICNLLQGKMPIDELKQVLFALCEDGTIHSAYDNDIYTITE